MAAKKPVKKTAKKSPAKKAVKKSVKKVSKKASAKRTTTKRAVKRSASVGASSFRIPEVPTRSTSTNINRISNETSFSRPSVVTPVQSAPVRKKSSSRTVVTILAAVVLIALLVVSRQVTKNNDNTDSASNPVPTMSDTAMPVETSAAPVETSAAPVQTAAPSAGHGAPQGIVAHYTASGARINWSAPAESTGIANYQVEINQDNAGFKVASTVPASQLTFDVTKSDTTGWAQFMVSTVYSDGTVINGKKFGLPGKWS